MNELRLNDLKNCERRFNADIMKHYISAWDNDRTLCSYVHLLFINQIFQYSHA